LLQFWVKTSRQPRKVKSSAIVLKFGTIVDWMNKYIKNWRHINILTNFFLPQNKNCFHCLNKEKSVRRFKNSSHFLYNYVNLVIADEVFWLKDFLQSKIKTLKTKIWRDKILLLLIIDREKCDVIQIMTRSYDTLHTQVMHCYPHGCSKLAKHQWRALLT